MAMTADSATPEQGPAPEGAHLDVLCVQAAQRAGAQRADIAGLTYEQARDELVDIVARLENGQSGLEESMGLWQRGEALAAHCATWLDRAEAKITAGD